MAEKKKAIKIRKKWIINPATKVVKSTKIYSRKKAKQNSRTIKDYI